jgi:hypothetical protein
LSSPLGGGITSINFSIKSSIPIPSLADTGTAAEASKPKQFSMLSFVLGMSALGISILLITGSISRLFSIARYRFAIVCASTP